MNGLVRAVLVLADDGRENNSPVTRMSGLNKLDTTKSSTSAKFHYG